MAIKYLNNISLEQNELQNAVVQPLGTAPTGAVEGQIYYDSTNNRLMMHDGTGWYSVNGDVESVSTGTPSQITVSGGTGATPSISAVTSAVTNGGTALATGDQIHDFVTSQGYLDASGAVTSFTSNTGLSANASATGAVTVTNTDRGSSQNIFKTIAVSGQDNVVADSNNDTLTFVAGTNVTITSNAAADSLQIDATNTTYTPGNAITFSGTQINHDDTSSVANLTPSSRTYVDGITFDTYGHVQSISTSSETVTNSDTTYSISVAAGAANDADIVLTAGGSGSGTDLVTISGTTNEIQVTESGDTINIGLPSDVTVSNNLTVGGNLTVNGTVTTVNTETINLADNIITLNSNFTGASPTENGGIEIERGTQANTSLFWNESSDRWQFQDLAGTYNIPKTGEYNPVIGTDSDYTQAGVNIIKSLTLTDGVIQSFTSGDMQSASTTQKGVVELATNAETAAGASTTLAVTPAGLASVVGGGTLSTSNHFTANVGDGTNATLTVNHNFGLTDPDKVMVQLVEKSTGATVFTEVTNRAANSVDFVFSTVPTSAQYLALFTKMEY